MASWPIAVHKFISSFALALVVILAAVAATSEAAAAATRPKLVRSDVDDDLRPPSDLAGTALMLYRGGLSLLQSVFLSESEEEDEEIFKIREKEIAALHGKKPRAPKGGSRQDLDDFHLQVSKRPHRRQRHHNQRPQRHPFQFTHLQPRDPEIEGASYHQLQSMHNSMVAKPTYHINIDKMGFYNWWELLFSIIRRIFCFINKHHVACTRHHDALTFDPDPFYHDAKKREMSPATGTQGKSVNIRS